MTMPPSARLAASDSSPIDWPAAVSALRDQGCLLDESVPPRRFASGHANWNFLVRTEHDWAVLRRPPAVSLQRGANDMARENRVLSRLNEAFPLAPRVLGFAPPGPDSEFPLLVLEYRDGRVISGSARQGLDALQGRHLSDVLVTTLAELHAVRPSEVGLDDLGAPDGFISRTVRRWTAAAKNLWTGSDATVVSAIETWLTARIPAGGSASLLHGDFKLDNFILAPSSLAPVALLDWDMATRGDPLFDLATLLSYWEDPPDGEPMSELDQMPTRHPGFTSRRQALDRYAELTGRDLSNYHFYRVLALLRLAVVFAHLHRLWDPTDAASARYERFGALSTSLLRYCDSIRTQEGQGVR